MFMNDDSEEIELMQTIEGCQYGMLFAIRDLLIGMKEVIGERYGVEPDNLSRVLDFINDEIESLIFKLY